LNEWASEYENEQEWMNNEQINKNGIRISTWVSEWEKANMNNWINEQVSMKMSKNEWINEWRNKNGMRTRKWVSEWENANKCYWMNEQVSI
jgi:hypothetical protein